MPRLFDKPEDAAADVKEHKDDAKLWASTLVLNPSTWYEHFNPRDPCFVSLDAQLVFEEHMRSELRLTWPPLVGGNVSELCSSGQFDSDCTLSLFPWNPGGYLPKINNRMTMMFRAASSGLHGYITCIIKESGQCFCHIAKIQLLFPISLKMRMQCLDLLAFANHDYELWHPPDQTIFCGWLVKFRRLQVFLVSLVQQQPWPSLQLIFLDSTEVSNYCDETATENLPVVSPLEELRHRNLDGEHLLDPLSSLFPPFFQVAHNHSFLRHALPDGSDEELAAACCTGSTNL